MDTKKTLIFQRVAALLVLAVMTFGLQAQDVEHIQFCDKKYVDSVGCDSITLFLKVLDKDKNRSTDVTIEALMNYLVIREDGQNILPQERYTIQSLNSGQRIPADFTFSVLIDQSIPQEGKSQIFNVVRKLVETAPDSCVYLSFFGDDVSSTQLVTRSNYEDFKSQFEKQAECKYFYGALYAKLAEFSSHEAEKEDMVKMQAGYRRNNIIADRARDNTDKNLLFIFTEGLRKPEYEENIGFIEVTDYQIARSHTVPRVFAFYYTGDGIDEDIKRTLECVTTPRDEQSGQVIESRRGGYNPADDLSTVLTDFEQVVQDAMYDYAFTYKATNDKDYVGKTTYEAEWKSRIIGEAIYSIGTPENPWPKRQQTPVGSVLKYFWALFVTLFTIAIFFLVMKVLIPYSKSRSFAMKYYRRYEPQANVNRMVCHYCKQDLKPGEMVVTKCKHVMHVHCWQQNHYKCAEFGQKCKTGIQEHVEWKELFTLSSLRDCHQTIAGICAGLISWVIFEMMGRGGFTSLATGIVKTFFTNEEQQLNLFDVCVTKVSAFLAIGFLLGFFLSLIFRHNDEYRRKDVKVYLKILGLSLLSAIIGLAAFAFGGILLCVLISSMGISYIPWYCSLPAYLLFSVCTALSLTISSTIPMKSALIGGLCSAIIGFLVLYFSNFTGMNMLLDFIIYGGGLGASLVTVRMLAEKYFLVIQNGVRAGTRIPIHKWMNATGGGNTVTIGMTGDCEIQMNWEKSNKVAKEHAQLYIDHEKMLPVVKPLATGVIFNNHAELPVGKPSVLSNSDTIKIGDTIFQYVETD